MLNGVKDKNGINANDLKLELKISNIVKNIYSTLIND